MILLRLYPFVYCDLDSSVVSLYNTYNKQFFSFEVDSDVKLVNKQTLSLTDTVKNRQTGMSFQENKFGLVDFIKYDISKDLPLDTSSELETYYERVFDPLMDPNFIKSFVNSITLCLSNDFDVFTSELRVTNDRDPKKKVIADFVDFQNSLENLRNIHIYTNCKELNSCKKELITIAKINQISDINIPVNDYIQSGAEIARQFSENVIVHVPSCFVIEHSDVLPLIMNDRNVTRIYYHIGNLKDISILEQSILIGSNKISYKIEYRANIKDLEEMLGFTCDEVLSSEHFVGSIIRNEWYNPLFWGNLYINSTGEVLCGPEKIIGKVSDWKKIEYSKIFEEDSLWRRRRNMFATCSHCALRNICLPISLIEILSERSYCDIDRQDRVAYLFGGKKYD